LPFVASKIEVTLASGSLARHRLARTRPTSVGPRPAEVQGARLAGRSGPAPRRCRWERRASTVPVGAQDEEARGAQLAGEELEQQQRRLIGGVKVVQHQHQRLAARDAPQEARDGPEDLEPRRLPVAPVVADGPGWARSGTSAARS
jgi:hypothetical protein